MIGGRYPNAIRDNEKTKKGSAKVRKLRKLESTKCLIRGAELLAGIAARTEPNARNWLGELPQVHPITRALSRTPLRTGQVAGDKCPNIIGG